MGKKLLIIFTLLNYGFILNAQAPVLEWVKGIGEGANFVAISEIAIDNSKNYVVAGRILGTGDMDPGLGVTSLVTATMDIFIAKYDSVGNFLWVKSIDGSGTSDDVRDLLIDGQNNVFLSGIVTGPTDIDPSVNTLNIISGNIQTSFLTVLDAQGDFLWGYALEISGSSDQNNLSAIGINQAGEVYFAGNYSGTIDFDFTANTNQLPTGSAAFFGKLNADGTLAWVYQITQANYLNSLLIDEQNQNIYLLAHFPGSTVDIEPNSNVEMVTFLESINAVIIKTDLDGNYISHTSIGSNNPNGLQVIKMELTNNELFVYGVFTGTLDLDPSVSLNTLVSSSGTGIEQDVFVSKFDNNLNHAWSKQITGNSYISKGSMTTDTYGNCYFSAYGYGSSDTDPGALTDTKTAGLYILKLNQNAERVWAYHDITQFATNNALIYNKYEHSIIGAGVHNANVDFDPQANVFNLGFYGTYLMNWNGCNSLSYIATVTNNGGTLTAVDSLDDDSFQWFDCSTNLPLVGEDSSVFQPSQPGNYQVQISNQNGACSDLSDCVSFLDFSNYPVDPVNGLDFRLYPNPTTHQIVIADMKYQFDLVIKNMNGETVFIMLNQLGNVTVDVASFTPGIYTIQAITSLGISHQSFIKI